MIDGDSSRFEKITSVIVASVVQYSTLRRIGSCLRNQTSRRFRSVRDLINSF